MGGVVSSQVAAAKKEVGLQVDTRMMIQREVQMVRGHGVWHTCSVVVWNHYDPLWSR